ncbi:MAG: hypothetical protein CMO49_06140, partial [Verrucomicrobiales bacterium]|nr:hypothetical protein [Verrucomicrobiales bacterium]
MKKKCQHCAQSRAGLIYLFVVFFIINFMVRSYFDLETSAVLDLLLLPSIAIIFLATCLVTLRYLRPN